MSWLTAHPLLREATVGVSIHDLKEERPLATHDGEKLFLPASVLKILTWGAALELLGPDHRFTTTLHYDAKRLSPDGELSGPLLIRGGGDPLFSRDRLEEMALHLRLRGITRIRGEIVVDSSLFTDVPWGPGWAWDDLQYPFSAPITSLSLDLNRLSVTLSPGPAPGTPAIIEVPPPGLPFVLKNRVTTVATPTETGPGVDLSLTSGAPALLLTGAVRQEDPPVPLEIPLLDPPGFIRTVFSHLLTRHGIEILPPAGDTPPLPANLPPALSLSSPLLSEIGKRMMTESDNFLAEMLLFGMAAHREGKGSFSGGVRGVVKLLGELGIPDNQFRTVDGSGLSRYNLLSPAAVTRFLATMTRSPRRDQFLAAFPEPGTGTLVGRSIPAGSARIWAKTGTMTGVSTIAGYLGEGDEPRYAFALFINQSLQPPPALKGIEDEFLSRLLPVLFPTQTRHCLTTAVDTPRVTPKGGCPSRTVVVRGTARRKASGPAPEGGTPKGWRRS